MTDFVEGVLRGLGTGSVYALLALGFVIIYKATRVISFAQPALMLAGVVLVSHLAGPLDITATGGLAAAMPILMFCIAFGLAMDYEACRLSRIKEEHDKGSDNVTSVARGLERTGGIVTAAALVVYFLAALGFHLRARDYAQMATPAAIEATAVAALVLALASG